MIGLAPLIIRCMSAPAVRKKEALLTEENRLESERLKALYLASNHGLTQAAFGATFEIGNQGAVWQCLNAKQMPISLKAAQGFARGLRCEISDFSPRLAALAQGIAASVNVNAEQFNVEEAPPLNRKRMYPVISDVQAGDWTEICDQFQPGDADEWRESHKDLGPCGFVLRVSGDSMTGSAGAEYSFPTGFLLFVNPELEALPGKFVVVRREGEKMATFKRYVMLDGEPYLEALNPMWPSRYIKLREGDFFCGVVVHAGRDLP